MEENDDPSAPKQVTSADVSVLATESSLSSSTSVSGDYMQAVSERRELDASAVLTSASETVTRTRKQLSCCICLELLVEPVTLQCGHSHCQHCLMQWFLTDTKHFKCPTCNDDSVRKHLDSACRQCTASSPMAALLPCFFPFTAESNNSTTDCVSVALAVFSPSVSLRNVLTSIFRAEYCERLATSRENREDTRHRFEERMRKWPMADMPLAPIRNNADERMFFFTIGLLLLSTALTVVFLLTFVPLSCWHMDSAAEMLLPLGAFDRSVIGGAQITDKQKHKCMMCLNPYFADGNEFDFDATIARLFEERTKCFDDDMDTILKRDFDGCAADLRSDDSVKQRMARFGNERSVARRKKSVDFMQFTTRLFDTVFTEWLFEEGKGKRGKQQLATAKAVDGDNDFEQLDRNELFGSLPATLFGMFVRTHPKLLLFCEFILKIFF